MMKCSSTIKLTLLHDSFNAPANTLIYPAGPHLRVALPCEIDHYDSLSLESSPHHSFGSTVVLSEPARSVHFLTTSFDLYILTII